MSCKACGELLDIYQHSVKDYATAVRKSRGLLGEELRLALKETIRLSEARKDANDALLAHFREDHHHIKPIQNAGSSSLER